MYIICVLSYSTFSIQLFVIINMGIQNNSDKNMHYICNIPLE